MADTDPQPLNQTQESNAPVQQITNTDPYAQPLMQQQQVDYSQQPTQYQQQPVNPNMQAQVPQQQMVYQPQYDQYGQLIQQPVPQQQQQVIVVQQTNQVNQAYPMTRRQQKQAAKAAAAQEAKFHFEDPVDRLNFIRKVYLILTCQLTFTAVMVAVIFAYPTAQAWIQYNWWMFFPVLIVLFATEFAMICNRKLSRKVPINYILLFLFTACETYFVVNICVYYTFNDVIAAAGVTAGMVIGLTVYAFVTKTDFTMMGGLLFVLGFSLIFMLLFAFLLPQSTVLYTILCVLVICLFGLYLIFDTQRIVGKGRYKMKVDDYILGALVLYADIITIFIYILALFGGRR